MAIFNSYVSSPEGNRHVQHTQTGKHTKKAIEHHHASWVNHGKSTISMGHLFKIAILT
jgi:hypothetical protein